MPLPLLYLTEDGYLIPKTISRKAAQQIELISGCFILSLSYCNATKLQTKILICKYLVSFFHQNSDLP